MKPKGWLKAVAALMLVSGVAAAQEQGYWRATSNTAKTITGDIVVGENKLLLNAFYTVVMTKVRVLEPAELSSAYDVDTASISGQGVLYRLNIPSTQKLLRKNTLCGSDDTTWMLAYASGRTLRVTFYSGDKPPVFNFEAMQNATNVCNTFAYVK